MARELTDEQIHELVERQMRHVAQVVDGDIPADSPADFVRPEGDTTLVDGRPWWFGPVNPDDETLEVGPDDSIG
jgi:hypothetical protein